MKMDLVVAGKRKASIAKASIKAGSGKVKINNLSLEHLRQFHKLMIREPIEIAKEVLGEFNFDIAIRTSGGGIESQIEAARLALAKAVFNFTKSEKLKKAYQEYDRGLLVADIRRKEPYKPGDSKARSKRQKSYR